MLNCLGSTRFVEPENELSKQLSRAWLMRARNAWSLDWLVIVLYVQWILQTTRTLVSVRALLRFSHTLCAVVSLALSCGCRGAAHSPCCSHSHTPVSQSEPGSILRLSDSRVVACLEFEVDSTSISNATPGAVQCGCSHAVSDLTSLLTWLVQRARSRTTLQVPECLRLSLASTTLIESALHSRPWQNVVYYSSVIHCTSLHRAGVRASPVYRCAVYALEFNRVLRSIYSCSRCYVPPDVGVSYTYHTSTSPGVCVCVCVLLLHEWTRVACEFMARGFLASVLKRTRPCSRPPCAISHVWVFCLAFH